MIRLYISGALIPNQIINIDDTQRHYLLHVMRQKNGDVVLLFNGQDGEWTAEITTLNKKQGALTLHKQTRSQTKTNTCILCPALIKKENMDLVLQKATELGATEIRPFIGDHSVVSRFNIERAQHIVREASEQCERLDIPKLFTPVSLPQLLADLPPDARPIYLAERSASDTQSAIETPAFIIGPEGGFSAKELTTLQKNTAAIAMHLGHTILRAETASIAALACWQFWDDFQIKSQKK